MSKQPLPPPKCGNCKGALNSYGVCRNPFCLTNR